MPPEMTKDDAKEFILKFERVHGVLVLSKDTVALVQWTFKAGVQDGIEFARES